MLVPRAFALVFLALAPLAGCITVDDGPGAESGAGSGSLERASSPPVEPRDVASPGKDDAEMTAEETVAEDESLAPGVPPLFTATRVHTIEGDLLLSAIPVLLQSSSGDLTIATGESGRWRLVATIVGYGPTAESARANRDAFTLAWAHEDAGDHFIQAVIEQSSEPTMIGPISLGAFAIGHGALALEVPADVALSLSADASSGDVRVSGVSGPAARIDTSSGNIEIDSVEFDALGVDASSGNVRVASTRASYLSVDVSSGNVDLDVRGLAEASVDASSGNVAANLAMVEDGSVSIDASSGNVDVRVPEDPSRGYDAVASSSSGTVEIALEDGRARVDEDGEMATFVTSGFDRRAVRTTIALSASSGNVRLGPA